MLICQGWFTLAFFELFLRWENGRLAMCVNLILKIFLFKMENNIVEFKVTTQRISINEAVYYKKLIIQKLFMVLNPEGMKLL